MALISLDKNAYLEDQKKKQELFKKLKAQDIIRFSYPLPMVDHDILKTLLAVSWNLIPFPIINVGTDISHDVAQHKYPNRDGARLESMGRNPLTINVQAVFANTISPGINEFWEKGKLYPQTFKAILEASLKSDTGTFMHPFFGPIKSKIMSFKSNIDSKFRGGEIVNITFMETIDDEDVLYYHGWIDQASQAAAAIDNAFINLDPSPADLGLPTYEKGFTDLLNDIKATIDQTDALFRDTTSAFDEIKYRCNAIKESCDRLNDSSNAFVKQSSESLKAATTILRNKSQIDTAKDTIDNLITSNVGTLSNYVMITKNSIDDLIKLNSNLLKYATIPIGTTIKYYKK